MLGWKRYLVLKNVNIINRMIWKLYTHFILKNKMCHIGSHTLIFDPMRLDNINSIYIGNNVFISYGSWIIGNKSEYITLEINDGVNIGNFAHIVALHNVKIEKSVLIADKVFITDSTHCYDDINLPIKEQGMENISKVEIGEGSWIGENVCIIGCEVGKHCIIGAGSIVTRDIPDYCIAVGNPAKIIKRYDKISKKWEKCN